MIEAGLCGQQPISDSGIRCNGAEHSNIDKRRSIFEIRALFACLSRCSHHEGPVNVVIKDLEPSSGLHLLQLLMFCSFHLFNNVWSCLNC